MKSWDILTWKNDSRHSINQRHWVDVFLRSRCCFSQPLLAELIVADETKPELLPDWFSRWLRLCCSFHCRHMRSRRGRVISFIVNRTNDWTLQAVVQVYETLRWVTRSNQRIAQLSSNLLDLLNIFPLVLVVWERNLAAANLREVMNTGKLQQSRNAIEEAHQKEPIECRSVSNFRQIGPRVKRDRRQC